MSSDAQNTANLANAQLSTGPRTIEGKATSSRNALKHGLTAKTVLLPGEDAAAYEALASGIFHDFNPANTLEAALTRELIDLQWRLQRVSSIEARILSAVVPDMKAFNNMSLHAARIKRQFSATLKELQSLQRANAQRKEEKLEIAATIHQADLATKRASTLEEHGFDLTLDEIEHWIYCKDAIENAEQIMISQ